jgi:hypothetical protein
MQGAEISRLRQINAEMMAGTIHCLSKVLTSNVEQAPSTTATATATATAAVVATASSIIRVSEAIRADQLQEIDKILERDHEIHLADLLAQTRKILASTLSGPLGRGRGGCP